MPQFNPALHGTIATEENPGSQTSSDGSRASSFVEVNYETASLPENIKPDDDISDETHSAPDVVLRSPPILKEEVQPKGKHEPIYDMHYASRMASSYNKYPYSFGDINLQPPVVQDMHTFDQPMVYSPYFNSGVPPMTQPIFSGTQYPSYSAGGAGYGGYPSYPPYSPGAAAYGGYSSYPQEPPPTLSNFEIRYANHQHHEPSSNADNDYPGIPVKLPPLLDLESGHRVPDYTTADVCPGGGGQARQVRLCMPPTPPVNFGYRYPYVEPEGTDDAVNGVLRGPAPRCTCSEGIDWDGVRGPLRCPVVGHRDGTAVSSHSDFMSKMKSNDRGWGPWPPPHESSYSPLRRQRTEKQRQSDRVGENSLCFSIGEDNAAQWGASLPPDSPTVMRQQPSFSGFAKPRGKQLRNRADNQFTVANQQGPVNENDLEFLRSCLCSTNISRDDRYKTLGTIGSVLTEFPPSEADLEFLRGCLATIGITRVRRDKFLSILGALEAELREEAGPSYKGGWSQARTSRTAARHDSWDNAYCEDAEHPDVISEIESSSPLVSRAKAHHHAGDWLEMGGLNQSMVYDIAKTATKTHAMLKHQRKQQDSDRLARIEEKLAARSPNAEIRKREQNILEGPSMPAQLTELEKRLDQLINKMDQFVTNDAFFEETSYIHQSIEGLRNRATFGGAGDNGGVANSGSRTRGGNTRPGKADCDFGIPMNLNYGTQGWGAPSAATKGPSAAPRFEGQWGGSLRSFGDFGARPAFGTEASKSPVKGGWGTVNTMCTRYPPRSETNLSGEWDNDMVPRRNGWSEVITPTPSPIVRNSYQSRGGDFQMREFHRRVAQAKASGRPPVDVIDLSDLPGDEEDPFTSPREACSTAARAESHNGWDQRCKPGEIYADSRIPAAPLYVLAPPQVSNHTFGPPRTPRASDMGVDTIRIPQNTPVRTTIYDNPPRKTYSIRSRSKSDGSRSTRSAQNKTSTYSSKNTQQTSALSRYAYAHSKFDGPFYSRPASESGSAAKSVSGVSVHKQVPGSPVTNHGYDDEKYEFPRANHYYDDAGSNRSHSRSNFGAGYSDYDCEG